jgi:hypothetical protein
MIRVNDDYVIEVDNYGYTAKRDTHKTRISKETGQEVPVYNLVGYYGSLESAIKGILDHIKQTKLSIGTHSLKEALAICRTETRRFNELLTKALE